MDPRMLQYYNRELQFIREMGGEFAKEYPKIAGRLGMDGLDCDDPYVERLLEGFSFLAARIQLKLDESFPAFTQHLLEMVYPQYLAPTPSMAVVQFEPDRTEGALNQGFTVERGSGIRTILGKGDKTPCEYRTGHDITLWPVELTEVEYFTSAVDVPGVRDVKAGLRLRLAATAGLNFDAISMDSLQLYVHGSDELPYRLLEQMLGHTLSVVAQPVEHPLPWREVLGSEAVNRIGFDDDHALLPRVPRSFHGYRLLHEYFAFPQRFAFVSIDGLAPALRRCEGNRMDVMILFDRVETRLENAISASHIALHCAPVINLFPKRADRIHLTEQDTELHIVPDRTRPLDFEVYDIQSVLGIGTATTDQQEFRPFYASSDLSRHDEYAAFFTVNRVPRVLSSKQRKYGPRSGYIGHEVYLSLVDGGAAPHSADLKQLDVSVLCTNRDLPVTVPMGVGRTDFTLQTSAPVNSIRCLSGPTEPRPTHARGEMAWRLINHLSLNYLSLVDSDSRKGAAALRELLGLYSDISRPDIRKQIEGVRSIRSTPVTRRLPISGPMVFGRGIEIEVNFDEAAFEGTGVFLLGAVLESFFAKYVSINSFTETTMRTVDRGEIMRWPVRIGQRHTL